MKIANNVERNAMPYNTSRIAVGMDRTYRITSAKYDSINEMYTKFTHLFSTQKYRI